MHKRLQLLAIALSGALASRGSGGIATFENFNEGDFFVTSFLDPLSGITFLDETGPNPNWTIEFGGDMRPSNYLSAGGFVPGPILGLPFELGFRGILPVSADRLGMSFLFFNDAGGTLTLEGFNSTGDLIASTTVSPPIAFFVEMQISIQTKSPEIVSFRTVPSNLFLAYDNIEFVPEPHFAAVAAGLMALRRRRRCKGRLAQA